MASMGEVRPRVSPAARIRTYAELVKFEHSIFALPFAYLGTFLASRGWPSPRVFFWVTVAMVGARTAAMALNRLIDAAIDARNPRTAGRHLPAGKVSRQEVLALALVSIAVLGLAAWQLNPLCLALFPLAVFNLVIYSYTKRWTWLCHLILGLADGWAPFGGYIAVTGRIDGLALLLGVIVALWVGAFDIIYATQDYDFDRQEGLHSIPVRFGIPRALLISRLAHALVAVLALWVGHLAGFWPSWNPLAWALPGWLYLGGWLILAGLLHYEHSIISPTDLSRVNTAFFNVNGYIAVGYFLFTAAAVLVAA